MGDRNDSGEVDRSESETATGTLVLGGAFNRAERYSPCGSVLCTDAVVYSCHPLSVFRRGGRAGGSSSPAERVIASCRRFGRESNLL